MEILFRDESYPDSDDNRAFLDLVRAEVLGVDPDATLQEANIGAGADYPVILVQIFNSISLPAAAATAGPLAVFFLGKKIKENLDAWLELKDRLKALFAKRRPIRADATACLLIALDALAEENAPISEFDISVQSLEHGDLSGMIRTKGSLDRHPDATYQITFYRYGEAHIFVMGSDGSIRFHDHFSSGV